MKVLIVDDNEELTDAVKDFLDSIGIECKVTNEGKEGLNEILTERGRYNLILLDMAMPQFSGYDVLDTLKKEGLLKSENIVIFTASSITTIVVIEDAVKITMFSDFNKPSFFSVSRTSYPLNCGIAISSKIRLYLPLSVRISFNPSFPSFVTLHSIPMLSKKSLTASVSSSLSSTIRTFIELHHP